jgi:hypothetical protein
MSFRRTALAAVLAAAFAPLAAGSARAGEHHEVSASAATGAVGAKGTFQVEILAKTGWHMNDEAPLSLKLTPPAGLSLDKTKYTRKDNLAKGNARARFDVAFTGVEAGTKTINAEASFVVCQETTCLPVRETLTIPVEVTAAAEKPAPGPASTTARKKKS